MKQFLFLLTIIFFAACNNAAKTDQAVVTDSASGKVKTDSLPDYIHSFTDTALENKITDVLMKLPFVKKSDKYIDSFSNHQHGMAFMMDEPQENEIDVVVQAGYNGGERFETYYRFFVNPKTMEIKVYDAVEDKKLTIKEYLKSQH
jgi:PhoPQ-activated pathogenicity-related protein